jgi:regulatory subunit for Cdc7p protein kinase
MLAVQPISSVLTPKKRAVPQEEVHCRNIVQGDADADERSESPSKRSRSSNTSSSTRSGAATAEEQAVVATAHPSMATSTGVSATFAEIHMRESSRSVGMASGRTVSTATASNSRGLSALATPSAQRGAVEQSQNPHPRPTTTRIDKHSRMSEAERAARERSKKEANDEWRRRYLKAFPSFVFHFDALDVNTKEAAKYSIERLGGVSLSAARGVFGRSAWRP